jgi:hypothetical protein
MTVLVLDTWAGRREYPVEILGYTKKRVRVRVLAQNGVMLPGRRFVPFGAVVLVPTYAVREVGGQG